MKRFLYLIIFLLVALCGQSQTINQKGVTYRYNGKDKRTPIGGVYIKPITAANGVVSDESNGTFTLALDNLKMGARIGNVRVTKQGMMVFNQQAVDEWSVRKDPLCLILCDADEFQKQKKNLIAIGESQAKKKYDKKLAELKKQNDAKQLKIDEYYNKLESLEDEYQNALKHMDEYADVFARIDESEVDTVAQRAIEMFNRGEIEESIHLLEQQNYMEKIKQANRTIEQADAMISTAEQAKSLAEQDKEKYIEGIKTQIAGYKLQNEWDKVKELLKGLADNLNTLNPVQDYAQFCFNQHDYKEAEDYYLRYIELLNKCKDWDLATKLNNKSFILVNLAVIYMRTKNYAKSYEILESELESFKRIAEKNLTDFDRYNLARLQCALADLYVYTKCYIESEKFYKSALEIQEFLLKKYPRHDLFASEIASTQHSLAALYFHTKRYAESENYYKSALETHERLAKGQPSLANTQFDLACVYFHTKRYAESEKFFKSALEIYERLAKSNPQIHESYLADTQKNLASIYHNTKRYAESENYYRSALVIYERLAKSNPQTHEPALADTQFNLACVYGRTKRYAESEDYYKSALDIYERLAKSNPQTYEPALADTQFNLACVYSNAKRYAESENYYKSALEIYERLAESNSQTYESYLADTQNVLARVYSKTKRYTESEELYKSALDIFERLAKSNPQAYEPYLADTQNGLACVYSKTKRYAESENYFKSALDIFERLAKSNPQTYEPYLANTQKNLASIYYNTKRYAESENYYKSALEIHERLAKSNSQTYESYLADTQNALARVYSKTKRYAESEELYKSALDIYERLTVFHPDLAVIQYELANLNRDARHYTASEKMYLSALETLEKGLFLNDNMLLVAHILNNLSEMHIQVECCFDVKDKIDLSDSNIVCSNKCEALLEKALNNYNYLNQKKPTKYQPYVGDVLYYLGISYYGIKRYEESEAKFLAAIDIFSPLAQSNNTSDICKFAKTTRYLAILYKKMNNFSKSVEMYKSSIELYNKLYSMESSHGVELTDMRLQLASLYKDNNFFNESESIYNDCISCYHKNKERDSSAALILDMDEVYYCLGKLKLDNKQYEDAIHAFEKSLYYIRKIHSLYDASPWYWLDLWYLSILYNEKGDVATSYSYNKELLLPLLNKKYVESIDNGSNYATILSNQSFNANLLGKFKEGEQNALEALKVDSTQHMAYTNLAAVLLFQGKVEEAEILYRRYKAEFKDGFLSDFAEYERLGIIPEERKEDVERIKAMLNEE